ncbi:hypothetical protein [Pseudomonas fragi]|uniref:hypothetical protein n=1 Tax=Pseudomonas fragi TaxID=296 RepID=UPI002D775CC9|nr:hypothetical protein [Pseudomonas fragi]WRT61791.1 hypothetical protein VK847_05480 [Pseudomonas fragi]
MSNLKSSQYIVSGLLNRFIRYYISRSFYGKLSLKFLAASLATVSASPIIGFLIDLATETLKGPTRNTNCTVTPDDILSFLAFFIFTGLTIFFAVKANNQKNKNIEERKIIFDKNTGGDFKVGASNIKFYCGSVTQISGIDAIVTSEDTDLNLGSLTGSSTSGRIRKMAATYSDTEELLVDNLGIFIAEWKASKNKFSNFNLGTCVECNHTYNAIKNDIKTIIFSVAIRKKPDRIACIDEVAIETIVSSAIDILIKNSQNNIFIPIFGLGSGGTPQHIAIPATVNAIVRKLTKLQRSVTVYIGVYTIDDLAELCMQLAKK